MNPVSEDIKDILEAQSSPALTFGTDLFVSRLPDEPDEAVALVDTGSTGESLLTVDGTEVEARTFQVLVRGGRNDYGGAAYLAESVRSALQGLSNFVVNGTTYLGVFVVGDLMSLGYDDSDRPTLSINFRTIRSG